MGRPRTQGTQETQEPKKLAKDYAIIKLMPKMSDTEPEEVALNVNCDVNPQVIPYDTLYPVHKKYLEALDHALKPMYEKKKGEIDLTRRKKVRFVKRFPYEIIERITKPQYLQLEKIRKHLKAKGQALTLAIINDVLSSN